MSRTDVHRPWDVQINDPYSRHRFYRFQMWATQAPELVPYKNMCGCRMCTAHYWYRAERRRSRHQWKQERIELLKLKEIY
jgi:hypothetical protein